MCQGEEGDDGLDFVSLLLRNGELDIGWFIVEAVDDVRSVSVDCVKLGQEAPV